MPGPGRRALAAAVATLLAVGLSGCAGHPAPDPFAGRELQPGTDTAASAALEAYRERGETGKADLVARIAGQPTATWLLPEDHPTAGIGAVAGRIAARADAAHRVAVIVVYGIADRDCGGHSTGGLPAPQYRSWVAALARGLGSNGGATAVVLEPDSLAQAGSCTSVDARTALIAEAAKTLAGTGAAVYLDGGNSAWLSVATMAARLRAAGVGDVRGFATNVSNFQPLVQERAYAAKLSAVLGGAHYVIDTSRNGRGAVEQWCNPPGRGLGERPHAVGTGGEDAVLWIKQPGESDGTCDGGPAAGTWWPAAALELAAG